ncbi:shikimate dehydrogenase [Termitidicoccus mucosus]|uniref:Shikimate dehydrogenase (NADP(+)) n=1 Tax=Termitidicoccus mucosus TaxID=1184151 RepID=A0A178IIV7_9BACT|nr:shikimate dehydrogenase [Opitutaceae bacterium TSB47]
MDTVFTLQDLRDWNRPGTSLAVLGHPIKHSLSPAMHNAALAEMARADSRFSDWRYHRFDIPPDDLPAALELLHRKKFLGVNLTVPHKILAFDLVAEVDPAARPIGAINTLHWTPAGWRGHNTDGYGLATAIRETLARELAGAPVILLGAGGAARGAAVECLQRRCASLWIANRTRANLDALLAALRPLAGAGTIPLHGFNPATPPDGIPAAALVINATSAGLRDSDPAPLDLARLACRPAGVFDMIYNPPQTRLLAQAAALGLPAANGLAMLVHQGVRALEIWTGKPPPVEPMRRAAGQM